MQTDKPFLPVPGIILVDPQKKVQKSNFMAVNDEMDDPHSGVVVAVGAPKPYDADPSTLQESPAKVGDYISYSIVGCEKIKHPYQGNLRHEFVVVPFMRVLGVRGDSLDE